MICFSDLKKLSKNINTKSFVLERTNLYGGISLLGPYFQSQFISIDCVTNNILKSGQYNKFRTLSDDIIKAKSLKDVIIKKLN